MFNPDLRGVLKNHLTSYYLIKQKSKREQSNN